MKIGINATAAFKEQRTGVEEYVFQLLKALVSLPEAAKHKFVLYKDRRDRGTLGFLLPENFRVKEMYSLIAWTQTRLAAEMFLNKPDCLFIPVHILPRFSPKHSVVAIHGLEYEILPEYYPQGFRRYLRRTAKFSTQRAEKVIAVSKSTGKDLVDLYGISPDKITVIHHGLESPLNLSFKKGEGLPYLQKEGLGKLQTRPYLLFLGRVETKKNILGLLEAFKILKKKYRIPHQLVLAGYPGFGHNLIKKKIKEERIEGVVKTGFVSEEEKWPLLSGADAFLFPSFYEGFGLPILEAQAMETPVVAGHGSCMPEIAGQGALFVSPHNPEEIAKETYRILTEPGLKDSLVRAGLENIKRFSWEKCAKETLETLTGESRI